MESGGLGKGNGGLGASLISGSGRDGSLTLSDVHGSSYERASKLMLVFVAMVVPTMTVVLALIPSSLTSESSWYASGETGVITVFWVLIVVSACKTHLFLIKLKHVWALEFLADELRTANILIQWWGGIEKLRWKRSKSDYVSLVFYLGCAVELFLEKKTTEAMALGLQMGFTMRNSFESLLQRPSQQAQRLASPSSEVTIISEALLAEVVAGMNGEEGEVGEFTRDNLVREIQTKLLESGWEGTDPELKDGGYWKNWGWGGGKLWWGREVWREYHTSIVMGRHTGGLPWWLTPWRKMEVKVVGSLHRDFEEIVNSRMGFLYLITQLLQNGQFLMQIAILIGGLSGGEEEGKTGE